jgi:hypothetical protein
MRKVQLLVEAKKEEVGTYFLFGTRSSELVIHFNLESHTLSKLIFCLTALLFFLFGLSVQVGDTKVELFLKLLLLLLLGQWAVLDLVIFSFAAFLVAT